MQITGENVYLMDHWQQLRPWPRDAIIAIPGMFKDLIKESVLDIFVAFSARKNAWVGVEWHKLAMPIRKNFPGKAQFRAANMALAVLLRDGLLYIPQEHTSRWTRWLNVFYPQIVCPTQKLLDILAIRVKPIDSEIE